MNSTYVIFVLFICPFLLSHNEVEGRNFKLSKREDDVIRDRFALNDSLSVAASNTDAHYAVVRTRAGDATRYAGAGGFVAIYRPVVSGSQYSASRILLKNGPDGIEVGWRVDPVLYGDDKCHVFLRTTINNNGCFGVRCPGFVITNNKFDIEGALDSVSVRGKDIHELKFNIIFREGSQSWILYVGPNDIQVGYWPKTIFTNNGLTEMASYVEWGGEVYSPKGTPKPPMGSSFYPQGNPSTDGLYHKITIADKNGHIVDPSDLETFADSEDYRVINKNAVVFFGGPGGNM